MTGVCTFYNKTPVKYYCKQQSISEIAMYGAEFLSGRKCCEIIIDHKRIFDTLENQLVRWTMYGETMRARSIARIYLKSDYIRDTTTYCFTMLEV